MDIKQIKYRFMTSKQLRKRVKQNSIALETMEDSEEKWKIVKDDFGMLGELVRRSDRNSRIQMSKQLKLIINYYRNES